MIHMLEQIDLQEVQNTPVTQQQSYDDLQTEMGNYSQIAAGSKRLVAKLEQLGDVCPTCEQEVDPSFKQSLVDTESRKMLESEKQIYEIEKRIKQIKRDNNEFTRIQNLESDWKEIYRSIDKNLPKHLLEKAELEERLERVRAELLQRKEHLASAAKENERRTLLKKMRNQH